MEYTLKLTVTPTVHEDSFSARLFIAIDEDDKHVDTVQIWEASILAIFPVETADPNMWALIMLNDIRDRLETETWRAHVEGTAKTMLSLTEPKQHYLM